VPFIAILPVGPPNVTTITDGSVNTSVVSTSVASQVVVTDLRPSSVGLTYSQPVPSTNWTVNHNFGTRPAVEVRDNTGSVVTAGVTHLSENVVSIQFTVPFPGTAYLSL